MTTLESEALHMLKSRLNRLLRHARQDQNHYRGQGRVAEAEAHHPCIDALNDAIAHVAILEG